MVNEESENNKKFNNIDNEKSKRGSLIYRNKIKEIDEEINQLNNAIKKLLGENLSLEKNIISEEMFASEKIPKLGEKKRDRYFKLF